jgi:hypothetical protein
MSEILTPRKTEQGWIINMPPEMAKVTGMAEGSLVVLYAKEGGLSVEVLPPPSAELEQEIREIYEEYKETFEELKRLGD